MLSSRRIRRVMGLALLTGLLALTVTGCRGLLGRNSGPIDAFAFLPSSNPGLSQPVQGGINNRPNPKEIALVVPPGTDMSRLVASITLNTEATVTVISTGQRVVQSNGVTPNNFNSPVTYAVELPGEEEAILYTVRVREASTNARLIELSVADSSYQVPAFGPTVDHYEVEVPFAAETVQITARAEDPKASAISIAGRRVGAGSGSGGVDFRGSDAMQVIVEVVAEDQQSRQEYRITVLRGEPDRNSNLAGLVVNGLPLERTSETEKRTYTAELPYSAQEVTIAATAESQFSTVMIGRAQAGADGIIVVPLSNAGRQVVDVVVTAQDGSSSAYAVSIVRALPDDNPVLASIHASVGQLSPEFNPRSFQYSLTLPVDQAAVTLSAVAESELTTVVVTTDSATIGQSKEGNTGQVSFSLEEGAQATVVITTSAESGDSSEYKVAVRRDIGMNSLVLSSLELVGTAFSPEFSPETPNYTATVAADVEAVQLVAVPLDASAEIYVGDRPYSGSQLIMDILLYEGMTVKVPIALRAPNGLERVYTVAVERGVTQSRIGRRILEVNMDNLRLSRMVAGSLNSNRSDLDTEATIRVRYQDDGELIYEDRAPVTSEKARQDILVSMGYRSQFVDMDLGKYLDIEVSIPTSGGRYLHYNTVVFADGSLDIRPDFLVLSDRPQMDWPPAGTPRPISPRVRYEVSDQAQRRMAALGDDFKLDDGGEFEITLELFNLATGESIGIETLPAKPGSVHGRGIEFADGIELPEGASVGYVLSAETRDGRILRDHGSVVIRTLTTFENGEWEYAELYVEAVLELIEHPGM